MRKTSDGSAKWRTGDCWDAVGDRHGPTRGQIVSSQTEVNEPKRSLAALVGAAIFLVQHAGEVYVHEFRADGELRPWRDLDTPSRQLERGGLDTNPMPAALPAEMLDEVLHGPLSLPLL